MKFIIIIFFTAILISCQKEEINSQETVTDIDGNVYNTVKIGNMIWMAENLKTTKYNDGTPIENITDKTIWTNSYTAAYCWYDNKSFYKYDYGALYNWFAVNSGKLAPKGWHIPTKTEFNNLHKSGLTNKNLLNTILGGGRGIPVAHGKPNYIFENLEILGYWWTSTKSEYSGSGAYYYRISQYDITGNFSYGPLQPGYSVRCVKD